MSFQWIFDRAESVSIDKKELVGQTITRNQTVRAVSRGPGIWKFTVKLPDGIAWKELRPYIEQMENANRFTAQNIQINNPGYNDWFTVYQGDCASTSGFVANIVQNSSNITLTSNPAIASGNKFEPGDIIQLGSGGNIYTVTSAVAFDSNTVPVNNPVAESTASDVSISVGSSVTWSVICTEMPQWTIFARDQVSWSGPFIFYEAVV